MENFLSRTALLFGAENVEKLSTKRVAIFGLGGVGGYVFESLVRSGIGEIDVCDHDKISLSNINRQILATTENINKPKVICAKERASIINPNCIVNTYEIMFLNDSLNKFDFSNYDYVVDAVDNVSAKVLLAETCYNLNVPIISVMGTGNKFDPLKFEITDIYKTSVCPLAKIMRKELKLRGIKNLNVVYSKEEPAILKENAFNEKSRPVISSNAYVPAVAGLIASGKVIDDLLT